MEVRYASPSPSELYHHGIKGQKWGIRRFQNYDGTLKNKKTKKKSKSLTEEERKRLKKKRIIAGSIAAVSAIGIATAAVYYGKNSYERKNIDKTIAKASMQRIQSVAETDLGDKARIYVSDNKIDNLKYEGLWGKGLSDRVKAGIFDGDGVYKNTYSADNLKVASEKSSRKIFNDLYKNDADFKKNVDNTIKEFSNQVPGPLKFVAMNPKQAITFTKDSIKPTEKSKYDTFNIAMVSDKGGAAEKYFEAIRSNGYDALYDYNDNHLSGYNTRSSMIIVNGKKIAQETTKKLSQQDIVKANVKAQAINAVDKYGTVTLASIGAVSAASAIRSNKELKEDDKKK